MRKKIDDQPTFEDLCEQALDQVKEDVHCGDYEAIHELLTFCPVENLIGYLPEGNQKKYKHLL